MNSPQWSGNLLEEELPPIIPFPEEPTDKYFMPKYIRQESDWAFGETVTHEDFNEKLNLNITANDYQTEVLENLLTEHDASKAYHIPYLDDAIQKVADETNAEVKRLDERIDTFRDDIDRNAANIEIIFAEQDRHNQLFDDIISGAQKVGLAEYANNITGIDDVDIYHYYGTNRQGQKGFHQMPPAIYADDIGENPTVNVDGIYYIPDADSVAESMLTEAVREKLNREGITQYPDLGQLPSINGVELVGNKTLADLNVQVAGPYLTSIPNVYVQRPELDNYDTREEVTTKINTKVDTDVGNLRTHVDQNDAALVQSLNYNQSYAEGRYARIGVNGFSGTPKNGDLLVYT